MHTNSDIKAYSYIPGLNTELNRYLHALYNIRRSAWGLALVINYTDINFSEAYMLDKNSLVQTKLSSHVRFTRVNRNSRYSTTVHLPDKAVVGLKHWNTSLIKPPSHIIWKAMKMASQIAGVKTFGGKVQGAPGCVLNKAGSEKGLLPDNGR